MDNHLFVAVRCLHSNHDFSWMIAFANFSDL